MTDDALRASAPRQELTHRGQLLADAHHAWARLTINERKAWCASHGLPYDHFGSFSRLSEAEYHYLADAVRAASALSPVASLAATSLAETMSVEQVANLRVNCHGTFNGGYTLEGMDAQRSAFHHGMDTVCNVLESRAAEAAR